MWNENFRYRKFSFSRKLIRKLCAHALGRKKSIERPFLAIIFVLHIYLDLENFTNQKLLLFVSVLFLHDDSLPVPVL